MSPAVMAMRNTFSCAMTVLAAPPASVIATAKASPLSAGRETEKPEDLRIGDLSIGVEVRPAMQAACHIANIDIRSICVCIRCELACFVRRSLLFSKTGAA